MTFCNCVTSLESRDPEIGRGVPNARATVKNKQTNDVSIFTVAHLSRRLIGELIVYQWSGFRRPSSASSTMLKHLLLRNRLADQSQILCGASLGRWNDILFAASGSHDQDGRHAHIWSKPSKIFFSRTGRQIFTKLGM